MKMKKIGIIFLFMATFVSIMFLSKNSCSAEMSGKYSYNVLPDGTAEFVAYNSNDPEVIIPSVINGKTVTAIAESTFYFKRNLVSVVIPNTVKNIGARAFGLCNNLTSITIPSSVTSIGEGAFGDCCSVESIKVDAGNTVYDSRDNCNAIIQKSNNQLVLGCKNTVVSSGVTSIKERAFHDCYYLTDMNIPKSVTSIGAHAFSGCGRLERLTLSEGLVSIGDLAFAGCGSIKNIKIPKSVTSLGQRSFDALGFTESITVENGNTVYDSRGGCNAVIRKKDDQLVFGCKNTVIPASVKSIGEYAFYCCYYMDHITIPSSVKSIEEAAFYMCEGLTSLTIPESVTSIGKSAFYSCLGLKSVTIPDNVTNIEEKAFENCYNMTSFTLSKNVTTINNKVFNDCSGLTSFVIPDGVTRIGNQAFENCSRMTSLVIPESVKSIGWEPFRDCNKLTIYCYENSYAHQYAKSNSLRYVLLNGGETPSIITDLNTGIFVDSSCSTLATSTDRTLYSNGGKVKQKDNSIINFRSRTYYTKLQPSDVTTKDKNGKEKKKKGKLLVAVTKTKTEPTISDGKIQKDATLSNIVKASIRNGKITVTASKQPGEVYLWVMDTGDAKSTCCAILHINAAPSLLQIFAKPSSAEGFSSERKNLYKRDNIEVGGTTKIYIYPTFMQNGSKVETKDCTYSVVMNDKFKDCFRVVQGGDHPNCFVISALALKNNKKTTARITIKCDQNGKKFYFTATAVNSVRRVSFTSDDIANFSGYTANLKPSDKETVSGTVKLNIVKSSEVSEVTDKLRIFAMGSKDGYDTAKMEQGKIVITSKPKGDQRKIRAKIGSDKKSLLITVAKNSPNTDIYYLVVFNTKKQSSLSGYEILHIVANKE